MVSSAGDSTLFDPQLLWLKNASFIGVYAPSSTDFENVRFRNLVESILHEVAAGTLKVSIDRTFPLNKVKDAYEYILEKKEFGRVILIP